MKKFVYSIACLCFACLFHTVLFGASPRQDRFLRLTLLLDENLAEIFTFEEHGVPGAITRMFYSALNDKASAIIVSGSVLQVALQEKLKNNIDIIPGIHRDFDVYRHRDRGSFLFLFIPRGYRDKVLGDWRTCAQEYVKRHKEQPLVVEGFTEQELALGLVVDHGEILERLTKSDQKLEAFRGKILRRTILKKEVGEEKKEEVVFENREIVTESRCIDALKSMFVKNRQITCGGKWIIYESGHGLPSGVRERGHLISMLLPDFKKKNAFYNEELNVFFVFVLSCYGGGRHLIVPYLDFDDLYFRKMRSFVMHAGLSETSVFLDVYKHPGLFLRFYNFIEQTHFDLITKINLLYKRMFFKLEDEEFDFSSLIPFVRFPGIERFVPVVPWRGSVELINYVKVQAHKLSRRNLVIGGNKKLALVSPNIIPITLEIDDPSKLVMHSIRPANSVHFLRALDLIKRPVLTNDLLARMFLRPQMALKPSAQKIFVIKDLRFRLEGEATAFPVQPPEGSKTVELENVVIVIPTKQFPESKVFFSDKHGKKMYCVSASMVGEGEAAAYRITGIAECEEIDLWRHIDETFVPVERIRDVLLLPGQAGLDYYDFLRDIAKLKLADKWIEGISPLEFIWHKVGFQHDKRASMERFNMRFGLKLLDPDINKAKALEAVKRNDGEKLAMLLRGVNDINAPVEANNQTILHIAANNNRAKAVRVLLDHGANPDARDRFDYTPLAMAALNQAEDAVPILLEYGARADIITRTGDTAFHEAVLSENKEIIEAFIRSGVSVDIKNKKGLTVRDVASEDIQQFIDRLLSERE